MVARLGADIYEEKEMLEEFLHRSGDSSVSPYIVIYRKQSGKIGEEIWKFHKFLLYLYITNRYNIIQTNLIYL